METVEHLVLEMQRLYGEIAYPFPYGDLDVYQSEIAGYCSWGRKSLQQRPERFQQAKKDLAYNFFEQHPRYLPLKKLITPRLTPKLYTDFIHYELMRETVLQLAYLLEQDHIRSERSADLLKSSPLHSQKKVLIGHADA